jgi:hypothetical protein
MRKNYKLQNTNYKGGGTPGLLTIPNYNVQNYKPSGIHASMHPCIHASMQNHSNSLLFPIFLSSQLPSFPLYPLVAEGKK